MRNPLLQSLENNNEGSNAFKVLADIRSGKLNAKEKVLEILKDNPSLRASVQQSMPQITAMARQFGVSDAEISAFKAEANFR